MIFASNILDSALFFFPANADKATSSASFAALSAMKSEKSVPKESMAFCNAKATQAAKELKRYGIMVNAVAPGGMVTPGAAGNLASELLPEEKQDEFYDELMVWQTDGQQPVDEVAIIAYALATPMGDGITGECVVADSGASHNIFRFQPAIEQYPPED